MDGLWTQGGKPVITPYYIKPTFAVRIIYFFAVDYVLGLTMSGIFSESWRAK
jgi:hypothetical protein